MIHFNKPHLSGKEAHYIYDAVYKQEYISGNGKYTKLCQNYFETKYKFKKCLLTTSCTDALEMAAILLDIKSGDEVIVPSYTFVSSALPFVRQGAKITFADSREDNPCIDENRIEKLINKKTKVIVVVHYAGISCNMAKIMEIADKYGLFVVEDAAHSIDSYYYNNALGSIGDLATFSFHETKNITCGEGGMLVINNETFFKRSEIIWEKGTNRAEFYRGETDKYNWVDLGSSFLPSEVLAAFLYSQLEHIEIIQKRRKDIWQYYYENLCQICEENGVIIPIIPNYATNNAHMFYLVMTNLKERNDLIEFLKNNGVLAISHYLSLHKSPYYINKYNGGELPNSDRYTDCLVRLPLYYDLTENQIEYIVSLIRKYLNLSARRNILNRELSCTLK